ncbi:MAG: 6-bladed beta-propeller [Gemmatimonadales bacterium]|nr:6-bladed beta-propeller [Gemmatimonadales bacterium]
MPALHLLAAIIGCGPLTGETLTIGSDSDAPSVVFGFVEAVRTLKSGRFVVVLDSRMNRLVVVDCTGRVQSRVGQAGRGPGEFSVPTSLHVGAGDTIHVLDAATARISRFLLAAPPKYVGGTRLPVGGAVDFCILGDEYVVHTPSAGSLFHRIARNGDLIGSFGVSPQLAGRTALAATQLTRGVIECSERHAIVLYAASQLPEVRAFSRAGEELWKNDLAGHRRMSVRITPSQVATSLSDAGSDFVASVVLLGADDVAVSLGRVYPGGQSRNGFRSVATYIIDLSRGQDLSRHVVQSSQYLVHVDGDLAFYARQDPTPHVLIQRAGILLRGRSRR